MIMTKPLELTVTAEQARNVVSQLPDAARAILSGVFYSPDPRDEETDDEATQGVLHVPFAWRVDAEAADPSVYVDRRLVARALVAERVIEAGKAAALNTALASDAAMQLRWLSNEAFLASDEGLRDLLSAIDLDPIVILA